MGPDGVDWVSETAQVSRQSRDFIQSSDGIKGCDHLALTDFMGDHNDFCAGLTGIELNNRLDGNACVAETATHLADHAGSIFRVEPHIVALPDVSAVRQNARSPAACGQQRVHWPLIATGLADAGDVEDVGHNTDAVGPAPAPGP